MSCSSFVYCKSLNVLSSHKRGRPRGVPVNRTCSQRIFRCLLDTLKKLLFKFRFKFQKNSYSVYGLKKVQSFYVECATKTQKFLISLRYSSCDNIFTAATVAVTTGGVSLLSCKNIHLSLQLQSRQ